MCSGETIFSQQDSCWCYPNIRSKDPHVWSDRRPHSTRIVGFPPHAVTPTWRQRVRKATGGENTHRLAEAPRRTPTRTTQLHDDGTHRYDNHFVARPQRRRTRLEAFLVAFSCCFSCDSLSRRLQGIAAKPNFCSRARTAYILTRSPFVRLCSTDVPHIIIHAHATTTVY